MVTHEMRFAREVCDRVVFMHQGRVHEIGPPEELFTAPATPELRQFLGCLLYTSWQKPCTNEYVNRMEKIRAAFAALIFMA